MISHQNIRFALHEGEEYIHLIQLLKAVGCVDTGAEAQNAVTQGLVKRNGNPELRKRAKIVPGDVIEYGSHTIAVARHTDL